MSRPFYPDYTRGCLHPESQAVLEAIEALGPAPLTSMSLREARASFLDPDWVGTLRGGVRVQGMTVPGREGRVPVRVYAHGDETHKPVLVFFHGGGFVLGALEEFDSFCALLAEEAGCLVVSVGYRLAPEHRFPAAIGDAQDALAWVASNAATFGGDPSRIAVAGDSAGANLAAGVCLHARDTGFPRIALQVLLSPWVDLSDASETAESFQLFGEGLWLSAANIHWYRNHYLGAETRAEHPGVSPLLAESLRGMPPALVITAEFDVLRDQGRAYALRLEEAGVPVTFHQHPGMMHDFAVLPGKFTEAWTAIEQVTEALRSAFQATPESCR